MIIHDCNELKPGMRVVNKFPNYGTEDDQMINALHLPFEVTLTIKSAEVEEWVTWLEFTHIPGLKFNSVQFEIIR